MKRLILGAILTMGMVACGDEESSKPGNNTNNTNNTNNANNTNNTNNANNTNNTNNANNTNNTNNNDRVVLLSELIDELHRVSCEAVWECLSGKNVEPLWTHYGRYESVEACKAGPKTIIANQLGIAQMVAGAESGRIDYDPALGRACVNAFKEAYCNMETLELEPPMECLLALKGTVPLGENCVESLECGTGNRCVNLSMTGACYGRCEQDVEVCGMSICLPTEYCNANVCTPRSADFQACTVSDTCMPGSGCMNGTCTPYGSLALDQACDGSAYCDGPAICVSGVCKSMSFGDLNATCGDGPLYCKAGLTCLVGGSIVGTCLPPLVQGASCNNTLQCEGNLICDNTCQAPKADGETCNSNNDCASWICDVTCQAAEICIIPL